MKNIYGRRISQVLSIAVFSVLSLTTLPSAQFISLSPVNPIDSIVFDSLGSNVKGAEFSVQIDWKDFTADCDLSVSRGTVKPSRILNKNTSSVVVSVLPDFEKDFPLAETTVTLLAKNVNTVLGSTVLTLRIEGKRCIFNYTCDGIRKDEYGGIVFYGNGPAKTNPRTTRRFYKGSFTTPSDVVFYNENDGWGKDSLFTHGLLVTPDIGCITAVAGGYGESRRVKIYSSKHSPLFIFHDDDSWRNPYKLPLIGGLPGELWFYFQLTSETYGTSVVYKYDPVKGALDKVMDTARSYDPYFARGNGCFYLSVSKNYLLKYPGGEKIKYPVPFDQFPCIACDIPTGKVLVTAPKPDTTLIYDGTFWTTITHSVKRFIIDTIDNTIYCNGGEFVNGVFNQTRNSIDDYKIDRATGKVVVVADTTARYVENGVIYYWKGSQYRTSLDTSWRHVEGARHDLKNVAITPSGDHWACTDSLLFRYKPDQTTPILFTKEMGFYARCFTRIYTANNGDFFFFDSSAHSLTHLTDHSFVNTLDPSKSRRPVVRQKVIMLPGNRILLNCRGNSRGTVQVLGLSGKLLYSKEVHFSDNTAVVLHPSMIAPGLHVIRVSAGGAQTQIKAVFK
jgi:hypothetical protein